MKSHPALKDVILKLLFDLNWGKMQYYIFLIFFFHRRRYSERVEKALGELSGVSQLDV